MGARYKTTGCLRFFIVLIILIPLTVLVASYIRGEDGLTNLKNMFKLETLRHLVTGKLKDANNAQSDDTADYTEQLRELEQENEQLREENARLQKELDAARSGGQ